MKAYIFQIFINYEANRTLIYDSLNKFQIFLIKRTTRVIKYLIKFLLKSKLKNRKFLKLISFNKILLCIYTKLRILESHQIIVVYLIRIFPRVAECNELYLNY